MRCFFNIIVVASFISAAVTAATDVRVPAMYVFGDSLVDVGNNHYLPGSRAVADFRPYGVDYPGGVPTGRFSNGYNLVDYLAMKMGFRESPPPALAVINGGDVRLPSAEEFRGLNFASGGSGILDSTGANDSISLSTQVDLFAKVVAWLVDTKGRPAADADLSRSPVVFSAGANDLAAYLLPALSSSPNSSSNNSSLLPLDAFVSRLVAAYRHQLRRIYNLGARKFVFIGVPKVGCVPGARAMTASRSCLDRLDASVRLFNKAVDDMLRQGLSIDGDDQKFSAKDFKYSVTNGYGILAMVTANPLPYGITDVKKSCCGLGTFDAGGGCQPNTTNFCSDRARHLYWDASHPTQAAAKLIADYGFSGPPKLAYPINVAQLLLMDC